MKKVKAAKVDKVAEATAKAFSNQHTLRIESVRAVAQFEVAELDKEVVGLTAAVARARQRRAELTSRIAGLDAVVAKR